MPDKPRARISQVEDIAHRLLPLRRAERLSEYFLYWIPVNGNPAPAQQRSWFNHFLEQLSDYFVQKCAMRAEVFLEYKTVYPKLMDTFLDLSLDLIPMMGFGYKPGVPLPPVPTMEDLTPFIEGKKEFNFGDYVGDFIYWFLAKEERIERENFFGHGGMTIMFLPPDPSSLPEKLPISPRVREHPMFKELFARFDLDKANTRGRALSDKWLQQSMELYAADLPKSPQMKGVSFIVPLLKSGNFLEKEEERQKLSGLCEFYVHESLEDGGVILASHNNHQDALIGILEQMREKGLSYSES